MRAMRNRYRKGMATKSGMGLGLGLGLRSSLRRVLSSGVLLPLLAVLVGRPSAASDFIPENSQPPGEEPPAPEAAAAGFEVPDGFRVTLFAGEPDVRQPVSMAFDGRGRLWVAECYSYGEFARRGQDRVVVLEDLDGDGRHDRRTVFWEGGHHLTSALPGIGGVWVLDLPELWFIPDADGDLVPDGPRVSLLEGFSLEAQHNMANGLSWGPDGWLYGRHGILAESLVGPPGSPEGDRVPVWCGMWRFHPVDGRFENVFRGMTNPWGHDWDRHGHLFLSGNVNGHLWHGIPGAFYERMHGTGHFPHVYERLKTIALRPHYPGDADWKQVWNNAAVGRAAENEFGGGHSHAGALVYQGTNWPEEYLGQVFMCNTHGRRINRDAIERAGSSFASRYLGDVATAGTPWFRGSALVEGPEGAVYVADWVDLGECHDQDGVHRTSGRIYRIAYREPDRPALPDLRSAADEAVATLAAGEGAWLAGVARRVLQERAAGDGGVARGAVDLLRGRLAGGATDVTRLRALWALWSCGEVAEDDLVGLLGSGSEHERCWAAQLLCEGGEVGDGALQALAATAADAGLSPLVRLYIASAMGRLPERQRFVVAEALLRAGDWGDATLENVWFYGAEPLVEADPTRVVERFFPLCQPERLRRFLVRRIASIGSGEALGEVFGWYGPGPGAGGRGSPEGLWGGDAGAAIILEESLAALRGRRGLAPPEGWGALARGWMASADPVVRGAATELAVLFGDAGVVARLRSEVVAEGLDPDRRARALELLAENRVPGARELVLGALADPVLRPAAVGVVSQFGGPDVAAAVLDHYADLSPEERVEAVDGLVTRAGWVASLLEAVGEGAVPPSDLSPSVIQRIKAFGDGNIDRLIAEHWGHHRQSGKDKVATIERYMGLLGSGALGAPDPENGHAVFARACAACHTLFGEGGKIGPDLTGSGRRELGYVLENVVDPSASVPQEYWMSVVTLRDGRILAGTIPSETETMLVVRTAAGDQRVDKELVVSTQRTYTSTMPEGILESMTDEDVRDLVGYLAR